MENGKLDSLYDVTPKFLGELEAWLGQEFFKKLNELNASLGGEEQWFKNEFTSTTVNAETETPLDFDGQNGLFTGTMGGDKILDVPGGVSSAPTFITAGMYEVAASVKRTGPDGNPPDAFLVKLMFPDTLGGLVFRQHGADGAGSESGASVSATVRVAAGDSLVLSAYNNHPTDNLDFQIENAVITRKTV